MTIRNSPRSAIGTISGMSSAGYKIDAHGVVRGDNHYQEQSLRLAGPLSHLGSAPQPSHYRPRGGGNERHAIPASLENTELPDMNGTDETSRAIDEDRSTPNCEAPDIPDDAVPCPCSRGLELQLAVRYDHQRFEFAGDPFDPADSDVFEKRFSGTAFTAGAKFFPLPWLMLRGSYATGVQPQPINQMVPFDTGIEPVHPDRSETRQRLVSPTTGIICKASAATPTSRWRRPAPSLWVRCSIRSETAAPAYRSIFRA